jgi:type II pantothenate kinase
MGTGIKDIVFIGNLTLLPQCRKVLMPFEELYGVRITIPQYAEFCTAIGAALCYQQ